MTISIAHALHLPPSPGADEGRKRRVRAQGRNGALQCRPGAIHECRAWQSIPEKWAALGCHNRATLPFSRLPCASFKESGLLAIDLVNPNCWSGAKKHSQRTAAEVRLNAEATIAAESSARNAGWSMSASDSGRGVGGGLIAGVAVATRKRVGIAKPRVPEDDAAAKRVRLMHVAAMC